MQHKEGLVACSCLRRRKIHWFQVTSWNDNTFLLSGVYAGVFLFQCFVVGFPFHPLAVSHFLPGDLKTDSPVLIPWGLGPLWVACWCLGNEKWNDPRETIPCGFLSRNFAGSFPHYLLSTSKAFGRDSGSLNASAAVRTTSPMGGPSHVIATSSAAPTLWAPDGMWVRLGPGLWDRSGFSTAIGLDLYTSTCFLDSPRISF